MYKTITARDRTRPRGRDGSARCGAARACHRAARHSAQSPSSRRPSTSAHNGTSAGKAAKSPRDKKKSEREAPASCHPPRSDKHGRSQYRPGHRACRGPLHHRRRIPQRRIPALRQSARYARSTSWHFAATAALRPTRISAVRGASSARCLR